MSCTLTDLKRRILVIDDNCAAHSDFCKALSASRSLEFEVECVVGFDEGCDKAAAALAASRPFHVAFVDMPASPQAGGIDMLERLWMADLDLQIVLYTACTDHAWEEAVENLGLTDRLLVLQAAFDGVQARQWAATLSAKRLVTDQARVKLSEMDQFISERTDQLKHASLVDKLTGLPNRELLHDRLNQLIKAVDRDPSRHFALLFLDFDRFKVVNDSLGHEIGDLLLIEIADRLRVELRGTDTVASTAGSATAARLGGDEFIVVLDRLRDHHDAARVTERLLEALSAPYDLKGHAVHTSASVGITTSAVGYKHPEDMIRDADTAMYRAKAAGKARYVLFDRQMHEDAMARLMLENDLRLAVEAQQFQLQYQPIISLENGGTWGFEALVRWDHPVRGRISPADFIPLAEEIGVIIPLGFWVLDEACRQLAEWRRHHPNLSNIGMSINVSRKQLTAPDLVLRIAAAVLRNDLPPASIKLEITESTIMEDAERGVHVLEQIRKLGVQLHMDDFGTGYSSLSCLHRFPINGLKIDRTFTKSVSERRDYAAVVNAIVTLTHNLDIQLVAEGVENLDQVVMLQSMGCDLAQGYYFSRPLSPPDAEEFLLTDRHAGGVFLAEAA